MIRLKGSSLEIETKLFGSATRYMDFLSPRRFRVTPLPREGEGTGERAARLLRLVTPITLKNV